jgi:hypothetical protein
MIGVFVGALLGIAVLVGIVVLANQPTPPEPCPQEELCPPDPPASRAPGASGTPNETLPPIGTPVPTTAGQTPGPDSTPAPTPVSNAAPYVSGTLWRSPTLGYSFEYDNETWRLVAEDDTFAQLMINFRPELGLGPTELDVIGFPSSTSVEQALQSVYAQVDNFVIGRAPNTRSYDALLGPGIGYVRGQGAVFSGTYKTADGGPGAPVGITVMGATSGRATVVFLMLTTNPDKQFANQTVQHMSRRDADFMVKTFLWESPQ